MKKKLNKLRQSALGMNPMAAAVMSYGIRFSCVVLLISLVFCLHKTGNLFIDYYRDFYSKYLAEAGFLILWESITAGLMFDLYMKKKRDAD